MIFLRYLALIPALIVGGPFTTIIAGSVSTPAIGFYNIYILLAVVVAADLCGDFIYYSIGKFAGVKFLDKIFAWYKIPESRIIKTHEYFNKYGGAVIAVGKIVPNFGWPVIVLAGSLNYNFAKFVLYIVLVSVIRSIILIALGYFLGREALAMNGYIWLVIIPVVIYLLFKFFKFKK